MWDMYIQLDNCTQQKLKKYFRAGDCRFPVLFRHHGLDEISRLVNIDAAQDSKMKGKELQRNDLKQRREQVRSGNRAISENTPIVFWLPSLQKKLGDVVWTTILYEE